MPAISALLLLSEYDYEGPYQSYPGATGRFEDAVEYFYFVFFRNTGRIYQPAKPEPVLNGIKVASKCKHPIHPTDNAEASYCPVCEVQICLDFLEALSEAMKTHREPGLRRTWRSARLQLEDCLEMREQDEEEETEWELEHIDVDVSQLYTAAKALRLGREEVKYCGTTMSSTALSTSHPAEKNKTGQKNKTVSFALSTSFLPKRPNTDYQRSNIDYTPGLHAAPEDDELDDASFMTNNHFNLAQMQIYVTTDGDLFNAWEDDAEDLPDESEGIARYHPLWDSLESIFDDMIEADSFVIRNEFYTQCTDSNVITVHIDAESSEILDVCLLITESDCDDKQENRNEKWTSWKEVLVT